MTGKTLSTKFISTCSIAYFLLSLLIEDGTIPASAMVANNDDVISKPPKRKLYIMFIITQKTVRLEEVKQ